MHHVLTFQVLLSLSLDEYSCKDPNRNTDGSFWSISIFSRSDTGDGQVGTPSSAGATPTLTSANLPEGLTDNSSESKGETTGELEDDERESAEYDTDEDEADSVLIIHPEAIHAMFELIKYADNEGTQILFFFLVSSRGPLLFTVSTFSTFLFSCYYDASNLSFSTQNCGASERVRASSWKLEEH